MNKEQVKGKIEEVKGTVKEVIATDYMVSDKFYFYPHFLWTESCVTRTNHCFY
jgi:hypothetical protein